MRWGTPAPHRIDDRGRALPVPAAERRPEGPGGASYADMQPCCT